MKEYSPIALFMSKTAKIDALFISKTAEKLQLLRPYVPV